MRANNRDCSHGRQFGKCVDCDVAELEEENARLRALVQEKDKAIGIAMKYMPFNPQSETLVADLSAITRAYSLDAEKPAGTPPDADQLSLNGEGGVTRRIEQPQDQNATSIVRAFNSTEFGEHVQREMQPQAQAEVDRSYVHLVPDHCDRIVWRGRYYHLHSIRAPEQAEPVAVVGDTFVLFWIGDQPIAPLIARHNIKIGDYLYTQPRAAVPDDLRQRCIEIMEWHRTGVVKQNGALAALAATLTKYDDHDRMRGAEAETVSEVIALLAASPTPPTCAAAPDGYRLVPIEAPQEVIARMWAIQNSVKPTYLWKELLDLCLTPPTGGAGHE